MRIVFVGAGAVGGYFGAVLCRAGADPAFLLRAGTLAAVRKNGLVIKSSEGNFTVYPRASTEAGELAPADAIVLAVKNGDMQDALDGIGPLMGPSTCVVTTQNGVDAEEMVASRYGQERVIGGVAYITSRVASPGIVEHFKRGILCFGELDGRETERLNALGDTFRKAGVKVQITSDIRKTKWEKLCWNATFNPLSVIFDGTVQRVLDSPEALEVVRSIIREIRRVAERLGILLSEGIEEETIRVTASLRDYHTSMYEDFKAGRVTENEFFNGAVCRIGRSLGVETPVNATLHALVKTLTESPGRRTGGRAAIS